MNQPESMPAAGLRRPGQPADRVGTCLNLRGAPWHSKLSDIGPATERDAARDCDGGPEPDA